MAEAFLPTSSDLDDKVISQVGVLLSYRPHLHNYQKMVSVSYLLRSTQVDGRIGVIKYVTAMQEFCWLLVTLGWQKIIISISFLIKTY
jgi:hypothetical protein